MSTETATGHETGLAAARQALQATLAAEPARWWAASELRTAVQNGWPSTVVSAAIHDLISERAVEVNDRLQLRLRAQ